MDLKLVPAGDGVIELSKEQKAELTKGFMFVALNADGGRVRKRKGLPMVVPKADLPRLLRGCGRAPTPEELQALMDSVPDDKGVELEEFFALYEKAAEVPLLNEQELFDALRILDLTRTDTMDPDGLKDILKTFGDSLNAAEIDKVLDGIPRDSLGRVSCRLIARKLIKGPEEIPHI
eukprot:TRINITY_DN52059_c0_g1_i1.p2 TRINITY_DN52059_c0_g1~~TRINITY_DN52059_c0_g1_i1.p2  ORF type:complete len:194 (+),score=49.25 TRINITY_DN52059_c0_g1_i1:54-584(+)